MQDLIIGIGLVLVIEGLLYALFPDGVRKMAQMAGQMPDQVLRTGGVIALALGVLIVWVVK